MADYSPATDTPLPASVELPDDGDAPDVASVNVPFESLLDAAGYLNLRVLARKKQVDLRSASIPNAKWTEYGAVASATAGYYQNDVGAANPIGWQLVPPYRHAKLQTVEVRIAGSGGPGANHAALPGAGDIASVTVYLIDDGVLDSTYGTTEDPSATKEIYDAPHTVTTDFVIDNDPLATGQTLWVQVNGEKGASAVANALAVLDIWGNWTSADTL